MFGQQIHLSLAYNSHSLRPLCKTCLVKGRPGGRDGNSPSNSTGSVIGGMWMVLQGHTLKRMLLGPHQPRLVSVSLCLSAFSGQHSLHACWQATQGRKRLGMLGINASLGAALSSD